MSDEPYLVAGRYRLDERIGAGGMGVVWRGHDQLLHRTVAVKQLLLGPGLSPRDADESRARAMREGRIAARLQHPHAINVFDVALGPDLEGSQDSQPWLVMEYLPSRSLADVLAGGPLPAHEVANIGRQVADALAAAHRAGIVHRDVKPGNVLIGDNGTVKITDFGIARASWDATVTRTGILAGTPTYFAPEVARGEDPDPTSDVFSLGSTLYAAVEGIPPFGHDDNTLALLRVVAAGDVRPPQTAGALTELLMQMLRLDPAQRPVMTVTRDVFARIAAKGRLAPTTASLQAATDTSPRPATPIAPPSVSSPPVSTPPSSTPPSPSTPMSPPPVSPPPVSSGEPVAAEEVAADSVEPDAIAPETSGDDEEEPPDLPAPEVEPTSGSDEDEYPPPFPSGPHEAAAGIDEAVPPVLPPPPAESAADDPDDPPALPPAAPPMAATRVEADASPNVVPGPSPMPPARIEEDASEGGRASEPRRRQRRRALAGVAVLALLAIVAAILAITLGNADDPSTAADPPTSASAPATSVDATPTTEATTTTTEPPPTTPAAPVAPGPAEFEQAVRDYYGLLPGNLDAAYAYLGPEVQDQANGRDGFESFWSQYSEVEAENVQANGTTVTLTIVYTENDGSTFREPYVLEMGTAEDGSILILRSTYGGPG